MFKPNRVGTPIIHNSLGSASAAAFTLQQQAYVGPINTFPLNVINAAPVGDFGYSGLKWAGTPIAVTASFVFSIVQQFTIVAPLAGDTVGLELNGAGLISAPASALLVPFVSRMPAATGAVLANTDTDDTPTFLNTPDVLDQNDNDVVQRGFQYTKQVIVNNTAAILPGVYCHGIACIDVGGAGFGLSSIRNQYSVRQLNDQQNIGYRDTLR